MLQVAVIGNASLKRPEHIALAQNVGRMLAESGYSLISGGLGGVMLESCRGFKEIDSSGRTIGILPSFKADSANDFIDIVIPTGLDVGRNQLVVASGFSVVVIGGGAGTLSEIALASQINKPIILLKQTGGWADKLTDEYLDERGSSRLYHAHSIEQLKHLLAQLVLQPSLSDAINSGHNR
jgi:uncharacterized protein (TIGR00725 family)